MLESVPASTAEPLLAPPKVVYRAPWCLVVWSVASAVYSLATGLFMLLHWPAPPPTGVLATSSMPATKQVFNKFDVLFHHQGDGAGLAWTDEPAWRKAWRPFFVDNFTYEFVHPFPTTVGFSGWFAGEHTAYNTAFGGYNSSVFIAAGDDRAFTCAAFHLATWSGPFAGVPAPAGGRTVHIKDLDFYAFDGSERISYNWCMVDVIDILQQGGYRVLPVRSPLIDDGLYPPPRAVDGLPAPNSLFADVRLRREAEAMAAVLLRAIRSDYIEQDARARDWAADAPWYGPGGIGRTTRRAEYVEHVLGPLHAAFTAPRLELHMLVCEANYCGAYFRVHATHSGTWLGVPATGRVATLTFGMHARLAAGHERRACDDAARGCIAEAWAQVDLLAAFASVGVDLLARVRRQAGTAP